MVNSNSAIISLVRPCGLFILFIFTKLTDTQSSRENFRRERQPWGENKYTLMTATVITDTKLKVNVELLGFFYTANAVKPSCFLPVTDVTSKHLSEAVAPEEAAQHHAGLALAPLELFGHADGTNGHRHTGAVEEACPKQENHCPYPRHWPAERTREAGWAELRQHVGTNFGLVTGWEGMSYLTGVEGLQHPNVTEPPCIGGFSWI